MRFELTLLFTLSVGLTACASNQAIKDRDYHVAVESYRRGDLEHALKRFPAGEPNGFITSVEKAWMFYWLEQPAPKILNRLADQFDERRYISITREAGVFLFQESEAGYVPSEHEIVVLHLISAHHHIKANHLEKAQIELRRATHVLQNFWDDPTLRIWLGGLWAATGAWDEAQVDFRRANELSPHPRLKLLANAKHPVDLNLHFHGSSPQMVWKEGSYTPHFQHDSPPSVGHDWQENSERWWERHQQRNTEIRDLLVKSNFMAQYLGGKTLTHTETGITKATTWSIRATAVAVTVALVGGVLYVAAQSNLPGESLGYLLGGAVGLGAALWNKGADLDRALMRQIREDDEKKQADLRIYRTIRFLPSWIGLDIGESAVDRPAKIRFQNHYSH